MRFEDEIRKEFDFLFKDYGFQFLKNKLSRDVKDFTAFAGGQEMQLMFIKDRADFSLRLGIDQTSEKWLEFYEALNLLKEKGCILPEYKPSNKMNHIKSYLKKNFKIIKSNIDLLYEYL